jgi:hypothetical protein
MASDSSSRPSLSPLPAIAAGVRGFATCPSCHTSDAIVTNVAVNGGADDNVADVVRRGTPFPWPPPAAYGVRLAQRMNPPHHRSMTARGGA